MKFPLKSPYLLIQLLILRASHCFTKKTQDYKICTLSFQICPYCPKKSTYYEISVTQEKKKSVFVNTVVNLKASH